jgi:murein L,D-transpeptidase YcbB/YkuD
VRTIRFDRFLASTALGVALVLSGHSLHAQTPPQAVSGVPVPDKPDAAPMTAQDLAPSAQATPAATPAPVNVTAPAAVSTTAASNADSMLTEKLRDLVTGKLDRSFGRKNERAAVESFYRDRNYAPLWIGNDAAGARAKAAIAYLATVDRDGLDPADYPIPDFKTAADPESLADAELKLTASVLSYARHALHGRIHYSRVAADISYTHPILEPADVLAKLADAKDVSQALDGFQPQQPGYQALKKALADLRGGKTQQEPEKKIEDRVRVPEGKILRPGMKDERVLAVRKRLDIAGDKDNPLYDAAVAEAVKKFQQQADLGTDGNLGANTVRAMNGATPAAAKLGDPVDTVIVNLDRWRWMPRELGNPYVVVNIPDYRLTLMKDDKTFWTTKIVVGKPGLATPLISAEMKFITVNPTWNVPPSIIEKEYLPALQEDPQALERIGLKVTQDPDGTVRIFQPPGAANALGRIRFNFPNKFLVYQHDTPDKKLFAHDKRAFSHGCMRVQNPLTYAEKLLSLVLPNEHYTEARLEKMFGNSESNINFPTVIPVHLTYQSAFVDEEGKLQLREDVYGRDARMIALFKGSERKVADIAIERAPNTSSKPVRVAPGTYGGSSYGGGSNLFDLLFGPSRSAIPPSARNNGRSFVR